MKNLITFLIMFFTFSSYGELSESEEYGQRYVLAALEMTRYSHFENLVVREAQNLSVGQRIDSFFLFFTSGTDKYDITFTLDNIEYTCFVAIEGRFSKKVRITNCRNSNGTRTLRNELRVISRSEANAAAENYQRRIDGEIENNSPAQENAESPATIRE